jgi:hypothetical protein
VHDVEHRADARRRAESSRAQEAKSHEQTVGSRKAHGAPQIGEVSVDFRARERASVVRERRGELGEHIGNALERREAARPAFPARAQERSGIHVRKPGLLE